jgi:hypothetical protein
MLGTVYGPEIKVSRMGNEKECVSDVATTADDDNPLYMLANKMVSLDL